MVIHWTDLQEKVRVRRQPHFVLLVVDASWSMLASRRMEAAKGAVLSLLTEAYQRRDRVGLIVFQRDRAELRLPPTNSVNLARLALAGVQVGGKTPLPAALRLAGTVLRRESRRTASLRPVLVMLTDGMANVGTNAVPPLIATEHEARLVRRAVTASLVIDAQHPTVQPIHARLLAEWLGAQWVELRDLKSRTLYLAVQHALRSTFRVRLSAGAR